MVRITNATPEGEIEITPEMIGAGICFLRDRGIEELSIHFTSAEFVEEFCRAVIGAYPSRSADARETLRSNPKRQRSIA